PRRGYRFITAVERKDAGAAQVSAAAHAGAPPPPAAPVTSVPAPPVFADPETPPHAMKPRRLLLLGGLIAASAIVLFIGASWIKHSAYYGVPGVARVASQRIRPLTSLTDETSEPAFSPDGSYVAFRRQSDKPGVSGIYVKAVATEEVRQVTNVGGDCCPAWAPDG